MMQTKISEGQNLLDVALQELGGLGALFDLADANGLSITDLLTPGALLAVPVSALGDSDVLAYFSARGQRINTGDVVAATVMDGDIPTTPTTQRYFSKNFFNPNTYA